MEKKKAYNDTNSGSENKVIILFSSANNTTEI